ncbi:MAG TPA: AraC family transcriptional regulator, partial [Gemmatimonadetes bacterium]|nr:AraC family transcriptional regulator [Gemmatimonadota bacterium]
EGSTLFETEIAARESLVTQVEAAARPDALVRSAVDEIVDSGGNVSVAGLARRLGISERHFQRRFRRAVGITPKQFSRV